MQIMIWASHLDTGKKPMKKFIAHEYNLPPAKSKNIDTMQLWYSQKNQGGVHCVFYKFLKKISKST